MINIGINGLGRIGKCVFIQSLTDKSLNIRAINLPSISIQHLKTYLFYDSNHKYDTSHIDFSIIDESTFSINGKHIHMFRTRKLEELDWATYDVECVIDSTGVFLTKERLSQHNVKKVVLCAPPKDNMPQIIVGVNDGTYTGETIVSNASCTTNCLTPVLNVLDNTFGISRCNFNTIHAITASQKVVDSTQFKYRTCRSVLDNIIPHKTGASKSVSVILPNLENKISGTALRIPVSNVSIVDLNVTLDQPTNLSELLELFTKCEYITVNHNKFLVSGDFKTNTCPSIVDAGASME